MFVLSYLSNFLLINKALNDGLLVFYYLSSILANQNSGLGQRQTFK